MRRSRIPVILLAALLGLAGTTAIGLIVLWPADGEIEQPKGLVPPRTERAEVVGLRLVDCRVPGRSSCRRVTVRLLSGPDEGQTAHFTSGDVEGEVALGLGDRIRVSKNPLPPQGQRSDTLDAYAFADFERGRPLAWLALAFASIVLVTGRWQGLRALAGLAGSLAVILFFVVPAILDGQPAREVALIGALVIMFVTIPLAHGLGPKTVAACLGTSISLLLTLGLADASTRFASLTGFASEEAILVQTNVNELSVRGLMLAGMLIGALGVLDDLTVSQSSTVMALRRASPGLGFARLFRGALVVGHDHIAATVNTLVLAYAGASLPILLLFNLGETGFTDAVNNEAVAEQIVATLVGSIGLIAAVPITTALAALLALQIDPRDSAEQAKAHAH